jgi:L-iditol 2-dehydrogenase
LNAAIGYEKPKPIGHEIAGRVEQVGEGVDRLAAGQTVALESSSFCGQCDLCRAGRADLCNKAPGFWGQPAMGFADVMDVPAGCCVPYEGLAPEVACQGEPGGVAMDMILTARIAPAQRVCVIGPGPIGLMAAALARQRSGLPVTVIGRGANSARMSLADRLGFRTVAAQTPDTWPGELAESFEHVLLTAPPSLIGPACDLLSYGGVLTYIGIATGDPHIRLDANRFHFRKLQLRSSFASPAMYFPQVLSLLGSGAIPAAELVTHRFSLSQLDEALLCCRDRKDEVVKVVVTGETS